MTYKKLYILLFLLAILPNINLVFNGYNLDDDFVTEINNTTLGLKSVKEIFTTHYIENKAGYSYEYRPITKLSFAIEHQFFGVNPKVSHFFNLLFYGFSCLLVLKFLMLIFDKSYFNIVYLSALLFAVLPVHSEVVASLKNRDILLCSVFCFLACIQLLKSEQLNYKNYVLAALFFLLALLSKKDAMAFVIIFPLLHGVKNNFKNYKQTLFFLIILIGCFLLSSVLEKSILNTPTIRTFSFYENPFINDTSLISKISIAFYTIGFYIKQIIFPVKLICYYGYNFSDFSSLKNPLVLLGFTFFVISISTFFKFKKYRKILSVSFLFLFVYLAMYSNFFALVAGVVADRYAYFSSIGVSLLLASLFFKFKPNSVFSFQHLSQFQKILSVTVLIIFCFTSFKRNAEWKNRLTLFSADALKAPNSYKIISMLATEQIQSANNQSNGLNVNERRNLLLASYQNFLKANSIFNEDYETLNNLGYFEMNYQGDLQKAKNYYQAALAINSNFPDIYYNLGIVYKKNNQLDSSIYYLKTCIAKFPEFTSTYVYLATIYELQNDTTKISDLIELEKKNKLPEQLILNHSAILNRIKNK